MTDPINDSTQRRSVQSHNHALLFYLAPASSIALAGLLYVLFSKRIPNGIAIHMGPDGVGYGSTQLMAAILFGTAAGVFAIAGAAGRGFLKTNHWFQTEKVISICLFSLGYGVVGLALATLWSVVDIGPNGLSGDSVGPGLLGFLFAFIASAIWYAVALPQGKMELIGKDGA